MNLKIIRGTAQTYTADRRVPKSPRRRKYVWCSSENVLPRVCLRKTQTDPLPLIGRALFSSQPVRHHRG